MKPRLPLRAAGMLRMACTACLSLVATGNAWAEDSKAAAATPPSSKADPPAPSSTADASPQEPTHGHGGQFSLRADGVFGYKMLFRYDGSPRCDRYDPTKTPSDQSKFCGFGSAPAFGLSLGFSPVGFFEPFVFGRFGLGDDADRTNMGKLMLIGAGARLYTMSDSAFKIFFSPWIGLDFTSGPANPNDADDRAARIQAGAYRTDILVGLQVGPQYDIAKWIGLYAAGGLSFDMLRYLGAVADLSIGVQVRAP